MNIRGGIVTHGRVRRLVLVGGLLCAAGGFDGVGPYYASGVDSLIQGPGQAFGTTDNMLGPPEGLGLVEGSLDVYTLGVGGQVSLALDARAYDGAGTDLVVYENPFLFGSSLDEVYIELLTVEVSTDGVSFARFPIDYEGPAGPFTQGAQQFPAEIAWYQGFAGVMPFLASPPTVSPFDIVAGGGDAFDLADLADDPAVVGGLVDLDNINFVRLTDVVGGAALDDDGSVIWDCGFPASAAADVDAVAALHNITVSETGRPRVEFTLDPGSRLLTLRLEDDDGLFDIKTGLSASIDLTPVPFDALLPFFLITSLTSTSATLVTGPVPVDFERLGLRVSAIDGAGRIGGDAVFLP